MHDRRRSSTIVDARWRSSTIVNNRPQPSAIVDDRQSSTVLDDRPQLLTIGDSRTMVGDRRRSTTLDDRGRNIGSYPFGAAIALQFLISLVVTLLSEMKRGIFGPFKKCPVHSTGYT